MGLRDFGLPFTPLDLQNSIRAEASVRSDFSRQSAETILRYGCYVGSTIEHFDSTDRLMNHAREQISTYENKGVSYPSGYVYSANALHSSKGRFLRSWHAPAGGVWITLVVVNTLLPESSVLLPLAAGVACCETVRSFGVEASVKWVNDVHVHGKKIAGILTESFRGPVFGEEYILLGIGLNVNNQEFPAELRASAGAMSLYGNDIFDLDEVRLRLMAKLAWNVGLLHYEEDRRLNCGASADDTAGHPLIAAWRRLSDTVGKNVHYGFNVFEKVQYAARVVDIDPLGRLIMKLKDGSIITENSGEIVYVKQ
nr:biotin--[acetyl-CoA-carboxylase] ligase [Desulfobulbaceae bacterium]